MPDGHLVAPELHGCHAREPLTQLTSGLLRRDVWRQPQPEHAPGSLHQPVVVTLDLLHRGLHRPEDAFPAALLRPGPHPEPGFAQVVSGAAALARRVKVGLLYQGVQHQPPFVTQRQTLPAAGLSDHDGVGRVPGHDKMCAPAAGNLLLGGSHAHETGTFQRLLAQARHRRHEGAETALGVHTAAPVQHVLIVYMHGDLARHGVDVAQQHHRNRPAATLAHRVSSLIDVCLEAVGRHPADEVAGHRRLVA